MLTAGQTMIMILVIAAGTMITRFTTFILFPENKKPPQMISYLGNVLPPAMMGLLVVYCLKDVSIKQAPFGIPEAIAIVFLVLIHKWKGNVLLSIGGATALYMLLVQVIF